MTTENRQSIGRYEVLRELGQGSQGTVHLARDPVLDRLVAVKVLEERNAELNLKAEDGTPLEARIASKLKHPNVVSIFDAGVHGAQPYLVFEYVEGTPLSVQLNRDGPMTIADACRVISAALQGVAAAHAEDVLHLDLNPRNILVDTRGVPRVMDFGLAQYVNCTDDDDEYVSGTLAYMSPEHMLGKPMGPWTDVFALGCTFYELVTGTRAMDGVTAEEIQLRIVGARVDYAPIADMEHGPAFIRFLQGALERDAQGRFANAAVMGEAFKVFLQETGLDRQTAGGDGNHSTIEFLLRRMQRKKDFPAVSQTLSDINRMTTQGADTSADALADVILRDFALTSKLLRIVNSAFYGTRAAEVTSVSQAVVILGLEKVRMTANSLMFFAQLKGDSPRLKDALVRSFFAGLLARHLSRHLELAGAEEAFICGLCQGLGENLAIYYFADEYDDILELQAEQNLDKTAAARGVLGVSYPELGVAVARGWNLPPAIIASIAGLPPGPVRRPADEVEALRNVAVFANELCALFEARDFEEMRSEIYWLLSRFERSITIDRDYCVGLLAAGFEKLKEHAPVFEINVEGSEYCRSVQRWLEVQFDDEFADEAMPPSQHASIAVAASQ